MWYGGFRSTAGLQEDTQVFKGKKSSLELDSLVYFTSIWIQLVLLFEFNYPYDISIFTEPSENWKDFFFRETELLIIIVTVSLLILSYVLLWKN
jgi:hypothetical protein